MRLRKAIKGESRVSRIVSGEQQTLNQHHHSGPPKGFRGPRAKLQNKAPRVCGRSEEKGQKARETGGTESGGNLRPL